MFAIIESGGRQVKVTPGSIIEVDRIDAQPGDEVSIDRVRALEAENADLKARLGHAAQRTRQLAARVKFIRQQQQARVPSTNGGSAAGATA